MHEHKKFPTKLASFTSANEKKHLQPKRIQKKNRERKITEKNVCNEVEVCASEPTVRKNILLAILRMDFFYSSSN